MPARRTSSNSLRGNFDNIWARIAVPSQDVYRAVGAVNLEGGEARCQAAAHWFERHVPKTQVAAHVLLAQFGSCEALSLVELSPDAAASSPAER